MDHLGPAEVAKKFPGMVKRCADCGFDLAGGQVEVVPTAHYLMGGVVVEPDTRCALPGLFVAGEDAGGAHGANRLGGNGVANSTVFGGIAGEAMAADISVRHSWADADETVVDAAIDNALTPFRQPAGDVNALRDRLLDLMWDGVGVLRDAAGLRAAQSGLKSLQDELTATGIGDGGREFNLGWHDWLNLQSLLEVSQVIAAAALSRENSRGAHYREDFTEVGSLEASYYTVARRVGEALQVERAPVEFTIVKPGESLI
jgi:fumarate reductase flavoprotein subunit